MDHADSIPAGEVLLEHAAFLTRLARGLLRDEHAAEDVVQDAFVRAMERPPRPGNLPGWLARVTRNLALSRLRSESRRRRREVAVARREGLPPAGEAVARLELQRRAVEAVLALAEPYRSTLVFRYFHGLSVDEIASRGELPRETVRTRLRRALGKVRDRLDADHDGDRRAWSLLLLPLLAPRGGTAGLIAGGSLIVKKTAVVLAVLLVAAAGVALVRTLSSPGAGTAPPPATPPELAASAPGSAPAAEEPGPPPPVDFARVDRDRDVFGVVVTDSGAPVAGAAVESIRAPYRRFVELVPGSLETVPGPKTTTATDGSFSLRFERGETADVVVRADGYPPLVRHGCPAGGHLRLVVREGRTLSIRVETGDGRPVPGARVEVLALFGGRFGEDPSGTSLLTGGTTGPDGRLALGACLPDAKISLVAWHEEHGAAMVDPVVMPAEGPAAVVLPEGGSVAGVVLDAESGEPVPGATLDLLPVPIGPRVTTDRDGRFVWPAWSGGLRRQGLVFARAEGYALSPVSMGERIELSRGGRVEGRLVSSSGEPVAGAHVTAIGNVRGMPDIAERVTDEGGRFAIRGLDPARGHALIFVRPGFGRTVFDLDPIPPGGVKEMGDVVLPAGRRIEGRVLDASGAPRPDVFVMLAGANADRGRFLAEGPAPERPRGAHESTYTDDLGRFRFRDLAPGTYEVAPGTAGPSPLTKSVTLTAEADRLDVVIGPEGGVAFTVRVVNEHAEAVAGAAVNVFWRAGPRTGQQAERTDAEGRAAFPVPAEAPEVYVSVRPPEDVAMLSATTRVRPGSGECRVTLARAATVAGTVLGLDGKPLAYAVVAVRWSEEGATNAATDGEGRFTLLVPVDSRVELSLTGQVGKGREPIGGAVTAAAGTIDIVLRAERIDTDRTLGVRVLSPDGEPVAGIRLNLVGPDHRYLRTDDAGRATARGLPARETAVVLHPVHDHPAFARWAEPERVTVVPEGQEVVLRFREGVPISGSVLDPDDAPARALVVATARDGGILAQVSTEADGAFRLILPRDLHGPVTLEIRPAAEPGRPGHPIVKRFLDARIENVAPGTSGIRVTVKRR